MKTCSKCGEDKPLDCFPNEAKRKDGKYPWCKPCLSHHRRMRYKKVPRKVWITQKICSKCKEWKPREQFRKYKGHNLHCRCITCENFDQALDEKGLTECSSCKKIKPLKEFYKSRVNRTSKQCIKCHKDYYKNRPTQQKLNRRDANLRRQYGISLEQYQQLMKKQGHSCPICLEKFEKNNYSYPVDHAHAGPNAGVIRAILHTRCNQFVMWKHTDPEQLRRAADLIESPLTDWFVPEEYLHGPKRKRRKRRATKKGK